MITLYGFGRVHEKVIGETRDLRAQWALEETGLPHQRRGLVVVLLLNAWL